MTLPWMQYHFELGFLIRKRHSGGLLLTLPMMKPLLRKSGRFMWGFCQLYLQKLEKKTIEIVH